MYTWVGVYARVCVRARVLDLEKNPSEILFFFFKPTDTITTELVLVII